MRDMWLVIVTLKIFYKSTHISDNLIINHFVIHDLLASIMCDLDFSGSNSIS